MAGLASRNFNEHVGGYPQSKDKYFLRQKWSPCWRVRNVVKFSIAHGPIAGADGTAIGCAGVCILTLAWYSNVDWVVTAGLDWQKCNVVKYTHAILTGSQ